MAAQPSFFNVEERYLALAEAGEPLERLSEVVDFRGGLEAPGRTLRGSGRRQGGRPPCESMLMFKGGVLQARYKLSDDQVENLTWG